MLTPVRLCDQIEESMYKGKMSPEYLSQPREIADANVPILPNLGVLDGCHFWLHMFGAAARPSDIDIFTAARVII